MFSLEIGAVVKDWRKFLKKPWNFYVCQFTLGNCEFQRKKGFIPGSSAKLWYALSLAWLSKAKNQDPWKLHMIFSWSVDHPEKLYFFFNWTLEFSHTLSFLQYTYPWNLHVLNPLSFLPSIPLFLNFSGIACKIQLKNNEQKVYRVGTYFKLWYIQSLGRHNHSQNIWGKLSL